MVPPDTAFNGEPGNRKGIIMKIALRLVLSTVALIGVVSQADAACRQVFSHTTCTGWGPMQKCVNHFRQQCDAPKMVAPVPRMLPPPPSNIAKPTVGGRVLSDNGLGMRGTNLISDNGH